jgi:hypothetical protein
MAAPAALIAGEDAQRQEPGCVVFYDFRGFEVVGEVQRRRVPEYRRQNGEPLAAVDDPEGVRDGGRVDADRAEGHGLRVGGPSEDQDRPGREAEKETLQEWFRLLRRPDEGSLEIGEPEAAVLEHSENLAHPPDCHLLHPPACRANRTVIA